MGKKNEKRISDKDRENYKKKLKRSLRREKLYKTIKSREGRVSDKDREYYSKKSTEERISDKDREYYRSM